MASMARKENIYKIYLENVTLDFGWSSPSIEECQELIEVVYSETTVNHV